MSRQRRNVGPSQGPTILDVAARAGVSVSTVSRVLNGRTDVAAATRSTIEHAIDELGFAPRVTAQRLAVRRSHTVSMLFPLADVSASNHDLDFVLGAAEATGDRSYFFNMTTQPVDRNGLLAMFRSGLVEGVILMQVTADDWRVGLLEHHGLPAVLIGRTEGETGLSWVDFDFEAAVGALFDYVVSIGHRHVGFLDGPSRLSDARLGAALRVQRGHAAAVARHGLDPIVVAADTDPVSAGQAALHVLDARPDVTALVAIHGPSTVGILRALAGRGLRVPGDVSVATIAAPRVADLVVPGLTCVPFPSAELGSRAARVLARVLDDRTAGLPPRSEQVLLPATVSIRETTAPPRALPNRNLPNRERTR